MILPGTYQNGFAPRDGEPLFPELQIGCVGDWSPGLGPTGTVLRDWSGRANHGTLTNMDPGTDWTPSGGRWALDFDGTNDHVLAGRIILPGPIMSVDAWVKPSNVTGLRIIAAQYGSAVNDRGWYFAVLNGSVRFLVSNDGTAVPSGNGGTIAANVWTHVAGVMTGAAFQIYINGMAVTTTLASASYPTTIFNSTVVAQIGARHGTDSPFIGQIGGVRVYSRTLSPQEAGILATRRGIAHELAPVRYTGSAGFLAAWRRQQSFIIGGGLQ